jgi:methionyl-tRNA formyltransferase
MLKKSDGAIDFARPAAAIAPRIRGVDPWPGAQAVLRGQPIKLFRARAANDASSQPRAELSPPGTVLAIDGDGAHVATADGHVVIRELQAPGRKRMTAQQMAAGRGIVVGDVLGTPVIEDKA